MASTRRRPAKQPAQPTMLRRQPLRGPRLTERIEIAAARLLFEQNDGFTIQALVDEAGVALQTFYRHFPSKDHVLLKVLARSILDSCRRLAEAATGLDDPLERLQLYVTSPLSGVQHADDLHRARVVTSEHFRLFQLFPAEVDLATQPFAVLTQTAIEDGLAQHRLWSGDPVSDARTITRLVMTTFHHYAYADRTDIDEANKHLWEFCLRALSVEPQRVRNRSAHRSLEP